MGFGDDDGITVNSHETAGGKNGQFDAEVAAVQTVGVAADQDGMIIQPIDPFLPFLCPGEGEIQGEHVIGGREVTV